MGTTPNVTAPREAVFLVGTGRCGSTVVYSLLAMHPDLGWVSSWMTLAPRAPILALANRVCDVRWLDRYRDRRFIPKPVEPNSVFDDWDASFTKERTAPAEDEASVRTLRSYVDRVLRVQGKARFLGKLVGRPVKITLLAKAFPGSFFIHVVRDLKPTVCSLLQVDFYNPNSGLRDWPWSPIPRRYLDLYEREGEPPELAAAIKVAVNAAEVRRQLASLPPERRMEVRYSEFVARPVETTCRLAAAAGLTANTDLADRLRRYKVYGGADEKWKRYFTPDQIRRLDELEALDEAALHL